MSDFSAIRGVLFDLDGVVHVDFEPIGGALDTLRALDAAGIRYGFVTNTTTQSPDELAKRLNGAGLPIAPERIQTSHEAAAAYLRSLGRPSCLLLVADSALPAYRGIRIEDDSPDCVVIGDIGERWNYSILNRVFTMVMDGAEMVALHKGRYWRTGGALKMDIGAFVAGLEYTTGKRARVIGKPSPTFFEMALARIERTPGETIMVGDDVETDVGGAQAAGMLGVLVKTGKYRDDAVARSPIRPDAVLDSIADLPRLLQKG